MGKKPTATGSKVAGKPRHVALLRGINVGGKHMLPMAELVRLFEEAGAADVRTYIQSGNVVFDASPVAAQRLVSTVADAIEEEFGFASCVVLRTGVEMKRAIAANPFLAKGADEKTLHVGFLERAPAKGGAAKLDPHRSPGDRFALSGREIYLHLPNGAARSKLTNAYFDSALGMTSTFRNWRTVNKLVEMASLQ